MAKKGKKVEIDEDEDVEETEDLEDLDDLEELADSEEPDEDEEDGDDEEDAPKKSSKKKKDKAKKESDTIGTAELAEALGTDGKNLRVMLRDHNVPKNENNRYEWKSVKAALKALGFDDLEEAQEALAEARNKRLEALKARNAEAKSNKAADSDSDDDDEDEEEAPKPKKKKKKKK